MNLDMLTHITKGRILYEAGLLGTAPRENRDFESEIIIKTGRKFNTRLNYRNRNKVEWINTFSNHDFQLEF